MSGAPARHSRPRCYVASPLGFTEGGRVYYRDVYLPALAEVVEVVDPWGLALDLAPDALLDPAMALEIGYRNIEAIRSCSLLVAYLEGQEPDSGTVGELGFAAALGLRCYGLRTDLRQSGEAGVAVNLQVEAFVRSTGGRIAHDLRDLLAALREALAELT